MVGMAIHVGLSFPAMMTAIFGTSRTTMLSMITGFSTSMEEEEEDEEFLFLSEQASIISAMEISPNIKANPPNKYGIGEFHLIISVDDEELGLAIFLILVVLMVWIVKRWTIYHQYL